MTLYLIPNVLSSDAPHQLYLPASVDKAMSKIDGLIAESDKGGRSFLKRFQLKDKPHNIPLQLLNKHTKAEDIDFLLEPCLAGETWGVVSDAGLPSIADPGACLVARARKLGIKVQAFVGPSSITLALMLSGFQGQRFSFHSYPPKTDLDTFIRSVEKEADEYTQIFIQAPHRNQQTLERLIETLLPSTRLCVAWDLTGKGQKVVSEKVEIWKKSPLPQIQKIPAIFLLSV